MFMRAARYARKVIFFVSCKQALLLLFMASPVRQGPGQPPTPSPPGDANGTRSQSTVALTLVEQGANIREGAAKLRLRVVLLEYILVVSTTVHP